MALFVALGLAAALVAALAALTLDRRRGRQRVETARAEASRTVSKARLEATALRRSAETEGRSESLEIRARADEDETRATEELARREERIAPEEEAAAEEQDELDERDALLREREHEIQSQKDRASGLQRDAARRLDQARAALEERAEISAAELAQAIGQRWVEETRADAAHRVRSVDHSPADPEVARAAHRVMNIAVSRYRNHFLTERSISNIQIAEEVAEALSAGGGELLAAIEQAANVSLHLSETGASVKLEGLDGVGREVARRALSRLSKKTGTIAEAREGGVGWAENIRTQLEREIVGLGRKAFAALKVPRAHPEIVTLVGALNYRTSYTQNQWLHAVEASFLAGMMASEMDLDIRLARRATLLHDIGKALTHKIEGSHAVIGADIARRLGEDEIVANAIGAHHADETPNSVYAHLVAAADAMSGARPGARRELGEMYNSRLDDLERIGTGYNGVDRAFAVHGGRELRVYVREGEVSDLDAVELSGDIADQIADELVFPGQIKVTVIRAYEATSVAS